MRKYNEYRMIVFTITTALVFALWGVLQPVSVGLKASNIYLSAILGFVLSLGFYKITLKIRGCGRKVGLCNT